MLQPWIAGSPENQEWMTRLGQRLLEGGHAWAAEWALTQVVSHGTPSPILYYELGRSQQKRGRLAQARTSLRQSLELKSNFYLCRRLLFDLCRQLYWEQGDTAEPDAWGPDDHIRSCHQQLRKALTEPIIHELLRIDDDTLGHSVIPRLLERLDRGPDDRERRATRLVVEECQTILEGISELVHGHERPRCFKNRLATIQTWQGETVCLEGLHDADDLIGYHLEAIVDDRLTFLPTLAMAKVDFGRRSDYLTATILWENGEQLEVAVPLSYYGSHRSRIDDVRSSDITILQELVPGLHSGLGLRSLTGRDPSTQQTVAIGLHSIAQLTFEPGAL